MSLPLKTLLLALLLAPSLSAERTVAIGLLLPQGLTHSARAQEAIAALGMALDEVNQRGGALPGLKVECKVLPGEARGTTLAAELVQGDTLALLSFSPFGELEPMMPVFAEASLPVLAPFESDLSLTRRDWANIFRLGPNDDDQASDAALFALRTLKKRKVVIAHDGSPRGLAQAEAFKQALRAKGVREQGILALPETPPEEGSEASQAFGQRLRGYGPNLVFYGGGVAEAAWLMRRVKEAKLQVTVMATDTCFGPALIEQAGDTALGAILAAPWPNLKRLQLASQREFQKRFKKAHGNLPGNWAFGAYDGGRLLLSALAKAGRADRSALRQAIAASNSKGLLLPAAFDANGDNQRRRTHFHVVHRNSDTKRIEFVYRMEH